MINWHDIDEQVENYNRWNDQKRKIKLLILFYKQLKYLRR